MGRMKEKEQNEWMDRKIEQIKEGGKRERRRKDRMNIWKHGRIDRIDR